MNDTSFLGRAGSEGDLIDVMNLSSISSVLLEAMNLSFEEGDSSSTQCKDSTPNSTRKSRRSRIIWNEMARLGLMQQGSAAGYFAILSDSPETKRRKQEAEMLYAKRRLEGSEMIRRILVSKEESPETKRRRQDIEDPDAFTRRLDAEYRRLELGTTKQEMGLRSEALYAKETPSRT